MASLRRGAPAILANVFLASGVVHLVRPQVFDPIMPRVLPAPTHRPLIVLSGLAELGCAYGLFRRTRWARPASVGLLATVFTANLQMALDAGSGRNTGATDRRSVAWGRLPLQLPMVWAALQCRPDTP
jgi:uncharacterized membrane protein